MTSERFYTDQVTHPTPAHTPSDRRHYLRAGLLFACVFAAGMVLAAGVAPRIEGFDRVVMLSVGSALVSAATAFILLASFLIEVRK